MSAIAELRHFDAEDDALLFEQIAQDIQEKGFSINPCALPAALTESLYQQVVHMHHAEFEAAGIGRANEHNLNEFVRRDEICWINGDSAAGQQWLQWTSALQTYLNRRLFLGLFSFESHFAIYGKQDFYKRHRDAFAGESNRVLSVVAYLNHQWAHQDGGELVLYKDDHDMEGSRVLPTFGTVAVFLSEEFPHEVLPANRERISIAGWFRVNGSHHERVDPPR
ncbi:2OG-Fe(II) oxygenase [Planctobacterium marinum]|uniref:2OG-Fe(II) oxygenase n=1 Tax=Planctobacterium marinum TaxID=1631968 RepID=UPI001E4C32A7|nr:2OG-Fe(II) oxygenase [Planctobacterium marinum]MCC2604614.1 2OG-Fe(II) oxygenase [Planctobacterium marinum]